MLAMSTETKKVVASKKNVTLDTSLDLPKGVSAKFENGSFTVAGALG